MLGYEVIGIGGMFNVLRIILVIYKIIEDIKEFVFKVWVINISNFIGIISEVVFRFVEFECYMGLLSSLN